MVWPEWLNEWHEFIGLGISALIVFDIWRRDRRCRELQAMLDELEHDLRKGCDHDD